MDVLCAEATEPKTLKRVKKDTQVHIRGHFKAKRQRHHGEVEGVDAVDLFE